MIAKNNLNIGCGIISLLDQGFEMKYVTGPNDRYGMFFKQEGDVDRVNIYDSLKKIVVSNYVLKRENMDVVVDKIDEDAFRELVLMSNE
ncbi:hypothetical protein GOV12_02150 [Candidatus Pacearchaeota archaeon]|nr:hypothetical protein [Candidatus Pacearchaeota archaeon]